MKTLQEFIVRYFKNEKIMVYEQDGNNCELLTPELVRRCDYYDFDIIEIKYEKNFDCITIYVKKLKVNPYLEESLWKDRYTIKEKDGKNEK